MAAGMKTKPRVVSSAGISALDEPPVKLSVNVSAEVGGRLRRLAFDERLSESSIVEIALAQLFARIPADGALGRFLRDHGATLRRSNGARR
jgi:hypothetical protein